MPGVTMNGVRDPKPHFVLVPLFAQGHMIPMIDFGRLLAERGALVTLITTPFNASRIKSIVDHAEECGLSIRFVSLPFPCQEAGLPEGCENVDVLPSSSLLFPFMTSLSMLRGPLESYLREHPPSYIVADYFQSWTGDVANEFKVPRLSFWSMSCFTLLCLRNLEHYKTYEGIADDKEPVVVPGIPHRIEITKAQAPPFMHMPGWADLRNKDIAAELTADGLVVNTCDGLEPSYVEAYGKAKGKTIWTVGPVSLYNKEALGAAGRGDKASVDAGQCLSWLDSRKPSSVIYVSLGSLARTPPAEIIEIGSGLEASNRPFIWVIKKGEKFHEVEKWLMEFEERTSTRGLVIRGWAPQVTILSHPSIGGFLTHCGWNSTTEGISAGLPMITWPAFGDQFLNERMIVEVLGIGVEVGVKLPSWWPSGESEALVKRDEITKAVERLMDEGEEGERRRRRRARDYREVVRKAMEVGGSSHVSITNLIQDILNRTNTNKEGSVQP